MSDHRVLAREMDLFHIEEHSPGMVFWHPNGWRLFQGIEAFMRQVYEADGFEEVRSPLVLHRSLWERSGHWDKFGENMFLVSGLDQEAGDREYALKPMSCPGHIAIYQSHHRSYRDLPLRFMEFGIVHRHERSGVLSGCMRLRQFVQDDAHIFCRESDLRGEICQFLARVQAVYAAFGYDQFSIHISLRPEKRLGSDELWDKAEAALIEAVQSFHPDYQLCPGEGAFYGPKIEIQLHDHLGRSWQCGTLQVDFNLPQVFDLAFINADGEREQPVMLHQAVLGSLERWIGILLEHHQGALPLWIAPIQVAIAPISEKSREWANCLCRQLKQAGIRVELQDSDRTISKKIRDLSRRKIPLIAIVGEEEAANQTLHLRSLGRQESQSMTLAQLEAQLNAQLSNTAGLP